MGFACADVRGARRLPLTCETWTWRASVCDGRYPRSSSDAATELEGKQRTYLRYAIHGRTGAVAVRWIRRA